MIELRPYQREAVDAILREWNNGHNSTLCVMATGTGKTETALAALVADNATRSVFLVNSLELIEQPIDRIHRNWPEFLSTGIVQAENNDITADFIAATWQTLQDVSRIDNIFQWGQITHLVVDESHSSVSPAFFAVIEYFKKINPNIRILGLTATPIRTDHDGLVKVFGSVAYKFTINTAIAAGALCPFNALGFSLPADFSNVKETEDGYDDEATGELLAAENVIEIVYEKWAEYASDRQTIGFTASVFQAMKTAEYFRERGIKAEFVSGMAPRDERRKIIDDFRTGKIQTIFNCQVLCLDEKTEILTSDGWIGIDEMSYSHKIACYDKGAIYFSNPKFIIKRNRFIGERMVEYVSPKMNFRVTENHRMLYRFLNEPFHRILLAKDMAGKKYRVPVSGCANPFIVYPEQPKTNRKNLMARVRSASYNYRKEGMDSVEARKLAEQRCTERANMRYKNPEELTLDDCRLIGFFIGDGCRFKVPGDSLRFHIAASNVYQKIIDWLNGVISRLPYDINFRQTNGVSNWHLSRGTGYGPQKKNGIFCIEPYLDKNGSNLLWGLNEKQFECFLEGFFLADGDHGKDKDSLPDGFGIHNTNKKLLDLIQAIAVCRGYRSSVIVGTKPRKPNHNQIYQLWFTKNREDQYIGWGVPQIKIESDWKEERVWCVTSETGNIVTRRNGKVLITGNTSGFDSPEVAAVLMVAPTKSDLQYIQKCGRGLRLAPGKKDALILDFAPIGARSMVMAGDILGKPRDMQKAEKRAERSGILFAFNLNNMGETTEVDPAELVIRILDLLSHHYLAWYVDEHKAVAGVGEKTSMLIELPDLKRVEKANELKNSGNWNSNWDIEYSKVSGYTLWTVENNNAQSLGVFETMESAQTEADKWAEERYEAIIGQKKKAWRKEAATPKQIQLLSHLKVDVPKDCSKGHAAQLITAALTWNAVKRMK